MHEIVNISYRIFFIIKIFSIKITFNLENLSKFIEIVNISIFCSFKHIFIHSILKIF